MAPPKSGYKLVWNDEFNTTLDTNKWSVAAYSKDKYWWLPCATSDNVYTQNKKLVLRIKKGVCPGDSDYHYNSGIVSTKQSWLYGYFEIRAKVAAGRKINNSFWLLGAGWNASKEIDMFETAGYYDKPYKLYMSYKKNGTKEYNGEDHSANFHTYGLEWTPDYISWLVDCVERRRFVATKTNPTPTIPMIVILSIYKGWEGEPDSSILPKYYSIDYVRVYQK